MRNVSQWAYHHPWKARLLIVSLYFLLNFLGIITGDVIYDLGIVLPGYFLLSFIAIVILLISFYPSVTKFIDNQRSYKQRKIFDLLLAACTFCMICFTGNQKNVVHPFTLTTIVISVPVATINPVKVSPETNSKHTLTGEQKLTKKENRRKAKNFLKQLRKKYKDLSDGEKILFVFLTIVVALAVIALLGALACSIACAGSEALGYVVFFLGTGAVIYLAAHIIHKILKRRKKMVERKSCSLRGDNI